MSTDSYACPVCLKNIKGVPVLLGCGHCFCESCVEPLYSSNKRIVCPLCSRLSPEVCKFDKSKVIKNEVKKIDEKIRKLMLQDVSIDKTCQKSRHIFVKDLDYNVRLDELYSVFRAFGFVESIHTRLSNGGTQFAFVHYSSHESAYRTMKSLHGSDFIGSSYRSSNYSGRARHYLEPVRLDTQLDPPSRGVLIDNLPENIDSNKLHDELKRYGRVEWLQAIGVHRFNVLFEKLDDCTRFVNEMNDKLMFDHHLCIKFRTSFSKPSHKEPRLKEYRDWTCRSCSL